MRDKGPATSLQGLASPPPPPPHNTTPPHSPIHVNRLSKTDPLFLAMVLRCGCEEAKTPSPNRMPHSAYFTDEHSLLPKTTAISGSGLQHETSASHSGPSHPEPAWPIISISTRARPRTYALLECQRWAHRRQFPLAATGLTAPLPLGPRDSPAMTTKDSRLWL